LSKSVVGTTQFLIQWVLGSLFPVEVKELERKADHLSSSSAEGKKGGIIPPLLYGIVFNY
jgi:hypothetical protein